MLFVLNHQQREAEVSLRLQPSGDFATKFRTDKLRSVFFAVTFFNFSCGFACKREQKNVPTGFSIFYVNNIVASSLL